MKNTSIQSPQCNYDQLHCTHIQHTFQSTLIFHFYLPLIENYINKSMIYWENQEYFQQLYIDPPHNKCPTDLLLQRLWHTLIFKWAHVEWECCHGSLILYTSQCDSPGSTLQSLSGLTFNHSSYPMSRESLYFKYQTAPGSEHQA